MLCPINSRVCVTNSELDTYHTQDDRFVCHDNEPERYDTGERVEPLHTFDPLLLLLPCGSTDIFFINTWSIFLFLMFREKKQWALYLLCRSLLLKYKYAKDIIILAIFLLSSSFSFSLFLLSFFIPPSFHSSFSSVVPAIALSMFQYLVDMALKQQQHQQSTKDDDPHHQHDSNPRCCSSCRRQTTSSTTPLSTRRASIKTTSTVTLQVNNHNDDWHTDKPCWSFKDDYVSFPSLDRFDMIDATTADDHHH